MAEDENPPLMAPIRAIQEEYLLSLLVKRLGEVNFAFQKGKDGEGFQALNDAMAIAEELERRHGVWV